MHIGHIWNDWIPVIHETQFMFLSKFDAWCRKGYIISNKNNLNIDILDLLDFV